MAYDEGSAIVLSMDRRQQARRRAEVRRSLVETLAWVTAGLEGAVSLEAAVTEAGFALRPAEREVLRAALA